MARADYWNNLEQLRAGKAAPHHISEEPMTVKEAQEDLARAAQKERQRREQILKDPNAYLQWLAKSDYHGVLH